MIKKINLSMTTIDHLRALALSFPETTEEPHFEKTSFRVKKKIFVTCDVSKNIATIKLSEADQDIFSADISIYPVPNKWGKQGWTILEMGQIHPDLFTDAVTTAYCEVAPPKLAQLIRP
ncbi:MAG: MmcQ/YjbR family DNA-binding protein [Reichenbachiella sp.]|uniref:MmcQ/YjbR family DNA-binding protein n=1 Tax=Reichenbachiella sp. TaxID=2184521 RepID=UPI003264BF8D